MMIVFLRSLPRSDRFYTHEFNCTEERGEGYLDVRTVYSVQWIVSPCT